MNPAITICSETGKVHIGDAVVLESYQKRTQIEPLVAEWLSGERDHGNGYAWLYLRKLTFGGQPATLSICFHDGQFEAADWSVQLPDAPMKTGWPTREAINNELAFVRATLLKEMSISPGQQTWGEVWSDFDQKAFMAGNGLRYRHS
jgi:hypothetical protein